jgi:hypothetical protein
LRGWSDFLCCEAVLKDWGRLDVVVMSKRELCLLVIKASAVEITGDVRLVGADSSTCPGSVWKFTDRCLAETCVVVGGYAFVEWRTSQRAVIVAGAEPTTMVDVARGARGTPPDWGGVGITVAAPCECGTLPAASGESVHVQWIPLVGTEKCVVESRRTGDVARTTSCRSPLSLKSRLDAFVFA